jgi:hypothetical protein
VSQDNLEAASVAFKGHDFQITTGNRYLGGYIGETESRDLWLQEKVDRWSEVVEALASAAGNFPQAAYAGLTKSVQQEWQFVQRVIEGIGDNFTDVQKAITECFLPALFRDTLDGKDDVRLLLHGLPVKHACMAIPDPTKSAKSNHEASSLVISHLFAALTGSKDFRSQEHVAVGRDVKSEVKSRKQTTDDKTLKSILSKLPCDTSRTIARGK